MSKLVKENVIFVIACLILVLINVVPWHKTLTTTSNAQQITHTGTYRGLPMPYSKSVDQQSADFFMQAFIVDLAVTGAVLIGIKALFNGRSAHE